MNRQAEASSTCLFETPITLRWSDQDKLGHVNNVEYFRYFEEARIAWLEAIHFLDKETEGSVIAHTDCNYIKSVVYPCELICRLELIKVGRSSFTLRQILIDSSHDELMAEGSATLVWTDRLSGKSKKIPDGLLTHLR